MVKIAIPYPILAHNIRLVGLFYHPYHPIMRELIGKIKYGIETQIANSGQLVDILVDITNDYCPGDIIVSIPNDEHLVKNTIELYELIIARDKTSKHVSAANAILLMVIADEMAKL